MTSIKPTQLLLTLGLVAAVSACTAPAPESDTETSAEQVEAAPVEETAARETSEGDEGSEDGEEYSEGQQANADFEDKLSGDELLAALQEGGYVIYFRHAQTEKDYADQADPDMRLDACETQRKLSEDGIQDAKNIGAAFAENEIPVGDVLASNYCRAWQTADLAFDRHEQNSQLNFLPFEDYTDEQVEEMKANVTPLMSAMPEDGQNTVLVGHDDLFEAATGIYPEPQGIAYVLKPDGDGGFELIANLLPNEWAEL